MEDVSNSAIKQHLLSNNAQFGFRHSAPNLITALAQTWIRELNSRGEVRVTALDIKAAFDQVWYQGSLAKLESMGIGGLTLHWLELYPAQTKIVVVIE
eukprot:g38484.t1